MALVVFLRGCNVGGHKTFRPTLLTEQLKHYDAVNIGAAGTFVIRRRTSHARLRADLLRRLPFEAEVIICEGHDLMRAASANPFADEPIRSDIVRFVSVFAKRPRRLPSTPISLPAHGKCHSQRKTNKAENTMAKIKTIHGLEDHKVVSQKEWRTARKNLLVKEKKLRIFTMK